MMSCAIAAFYMASRVWNERSTTRGFMCLIKGSQIKSLKRDRNIVVYRVKICRNGSSLLKFGYLINAVERYYIDKYEKRVERTKSKCKKNG